MIRLIKQFLGLQVHKPETAIEMRLRKVRQAVMVDYLGSALIVLGLIGFCGYLRWLI